MEQLEKKLADLKTKFKEAANKVHLDENELELKKLSDQINRQGFWNNREKAQEISKQAAFINRKISPWLAIKKDLSDLTELVALGDSSIEEEVKTQSSSLIKQFDELKKELRFSGPYDDHDVILSIYAGAGGTDAQDWAQMLLRMYVRWAESEKLRLKTIEQSAGEEAGLKSVTIEVSGGNNIYGKLKGEQGVHRMVRLSPFNADNLRQTSFAKVDILPAIDKPEEVQIDEKDMKIDVFRAGGHGGQSVNTTDSAVRVTHIPTGITVVIQNERSQIQNRQMALTILRSRLAALQLEQHAENLSELKGPNQSAEWGSQIRNYVLHPYKQVKDLRSGYETSDAEKVLDGNLEPLIEANLENIG